MKPFIKDGRGNPSWSATILVFGFLLMAFVIVCCVWAPDDKAMHAQAILFTVVTAFFGIASLYFGRRGTEVYERVKTLNGSTSAVDIAGIVKGLVKSTVDKPAETVTREDG